MTYKHTATDSRGQVHRRVSLNRRYSHAIVLHYNGAANREPRSRACWASSLELAERASVTEGKHADAVEILPATVIDTNARPIKQTG